MMSNSPSETPNAKLPAKDKVTGKAQVKAEQDPKSGADIASEIGGPKGPEPTRFGDWEQKGRCSDF
jgi:hypothetical protein